MEQLCEFTSENSSKLLNSVSPKIKHVGETLTATEALFSIKCKIDSNVL